MRWSSTGLKPRNGGILLISALPKTVAIIPGKFKQGKPCLVRSARSNRHLSTGMGPALLLPPDAGSFCRFPRRLLDSTYLFTDGLKVSLPLDFLCYRFNIKDEIKECPPISRG